MSLSIRPIWLGDARITAHQAGNGWRSHISVRYSSTCVCVRYERANLRYTHYLPPQKMDLGLCVTITHFIESVNAFCIFRNSIDSMSPTQVFVPCFSVFFFLSSQIFWTSFLISPISSPHTEIWGVGSQSCARPKRGTAQEISTPPSDVLRWRPK